jgi:hypothetical protein
MVLCRENGTGFSGTVYTVVNYHCIPVNTFSITILVTDERNYFIIDYTYLLRILTGCNPYRTIVPRRTEIHRALESGAWSRSPEAVILITAQRRRGDLVDLGSCRCRRE